MPVIFDIVKKNLKLLIRSKSSALIIILGPLLLIFLVGIAFDNLNQFSLNIGTYSESYSELSESFIVKLQEKEFNVEKVTSEDACVEQIKQGQIHTCVIFPPNLAIQPGVTNEITFHVDHSKINLVWMVLDTLSTRLEERSSELSLDLTTNLINKLEYTKSTIFETKPIAEGLNSEVQQSSQKISEFRKDTVAFRDESNNMKTYFLTKVKGARAEVETIKRAIDDTNASESERTSLKQKASSIDTFLYNMHTKIEDTNTSKETDWEKIQRLTAGVVTQINTLSNLVTASETKVEQIQSALDDMYNNLANIQIKEATTIVNPITTNIKPVIPERTYLNYMFPALIVLVVMFISILLSTTLVQMEKHSPAYFRNFITPTRSITFIFGTYLTNMLLVTTQLIIIIIISANFFEAQIVPNLNIIIPALLLITTLFTIIGLLIGHLFMSEETATLAAISTGSVFLFLSNVILPLESMPEYMRRIAQYNPFVLSETMLRKTVIFHEQFVAIQNEMLYLGIASIVLFALVWGIYKIKRKHTFHHLFSSKEESVKKKEQK